MYLPHVLITDDATVLSRGGEIYYKTFLPVLIDWLLFSSLGLIWRETYLLSQDGVLQDKHAKFWFFTTKKKNPPPPKLWEHFLIFFSSF